MSARWKSRKFWISVAALLASVGTAISGLVVENELIVAAGVVCSALSAAIYTACETEIDKASVKKNSEEEEING